MPGLGENEMMPKGGMPWSVRLTNGLAIVCSRARNGQHFHHFDSLAWEDREVWVIHEQASCANLRLRLDDGEGSPVVANVADAARRDQLGSTERATHFDYGRSVLSCPLLPSSNTFGLLALAWFRKARFWVTRIGKITGRVGTTS